MRTTRALLILLVLCLAIGAAATHTAAAADTTVYKVWFARAGKLWLVKREQPATTAPARAAMQALLAGPNLAESDAGVSSRIPAEAELLGLSVANGTATVDLSAAFAAADTAAAVRMRLAQVTYTLTQFPSVDRVVLRVNGRAAGSIAGVAVPQPMTQSSYSALLPAITVWNPAIGSHLSGSVRVTGLADVFEASLHVRIVNQNGTTIARASTTASCGTGCWGGYTVLVPFSVSRDQLGTIVVADDDADGDGLPQHQVRIPVVLLA
jgi:sporulation and spore germination protein/immunoglobulin-like protein involved in spore germination